MGMIVCNEYSTECSLHEFITFMKWIFHVATEVVPVTLGFCLPRVSVSRPCSSFMSLAAYMASYPVDANKVRNYFPHVRFGLRQFVSHSIHDSLSLGLENRYSHRPTGQRCFSRFNMPEVCYGIRLAFVSRFLAEVQEFLLVLVSLAAVPLTSC